MLEELLQAMPIWPTTNARSTNDDYREKCASDAAILKRFVRPGQHGHELNQPNLERNGKFAAEFNIPSH